MKAVTTAQMRALDAATSARGTPASALMERAGQAVARIAADELRRAAARRVLLFAGKGNNGGDAVIAARRLAQTGAEVALANFGPHADLPANIRRFAPGDAWPAADVIVDGLLGTGLTGPVREPFARAIDYINCQSAATVIAIDIPSGLDGDTGEPHGGAVRADITLTMGLPKLGLLRPAALEYVGRLEVADLGFPADLVAAIETGVNWISRADIAPLLPRRARAAHKGAFGNLLIVAGGEGYCGAAVLCATAAARSGVGLVTLATPARVYPIVAAQCPPEIMVRPLEIVSDPTGFSAVVIGPGLGQTAATHQQVAHWLAAARVPVVVDADGLNSISAQRALLRRATAPLILTPHPGEMGRLTGLTTGEVQAARWDVAQRFAREQGVTLALKGAGTVVADARGGLWINSTGNPGMARGGMGDVLAGLIGALLAQGWAPLDAARAGVFLHGLAGDHARERHGEIAMQASDLIDCLGAVFQTFAQRG